MTHPLAKLRGQIIQRRANETSGPIKQEIL